MLISKNRAVSIVDCVGISVKADACAAIVDDNIYAGPSDWGRDFNGNDPRYY